MEPKMELLLLYMDPLKNQKKYSRIWSAKKNSLFLPFAGYPPPRGPKQGPINFFIENTVWRARVSNN